MPITEEVLEATTLGRAINNASDQRLRVVLKSICAKNDQARKEAESQFLVMATNTEKSSDSNKRAAPRYAFCINCEKEFDVTTNTEKNCRYHPVTIAQKSRLWSNRVMLNKLIHNRGKWAHWRRSFCWQLGWVWGGHRWNARGFSPLLYVHVLQWKPGREPDFHREQHPEEKPSKRSRAVWDGEQWNTV